VVCVSKLLCPARPTEEVFANRNPVYLRILRIERERGVTAKKKKVPLKWPSSTTTRKLHSTLLSLQVSPTLNRPPVYALYYYVLCAKNDFWIRFRRKSCIQTPKHARLTIPVILLQRFESSHRSAASGTSDKTGIFILLQYFPTSQLHSWLSNAS
jgi:hypothetical protein